MILRLSHLQITVADLAAARDFYVDLLGFVEHAAEAEVLYLRAPEEFDLWSLKIVRGRSGGLVHSGFRVESEQDLERLQRDHRALGLPAALIADGAEPGHGRTLRCGTPDGHAIAFVHEIEEVDLYGDGRLRLPMRSARHGGVPPTRLDHVSLRVADMPAELGYWTRTLRFSASEMWLEAEDVPRIAWLRRSPRSHDLALGRDSRSAFHHFAYAVSDPSALLRAADLLGDARQQDRLEFGPSRHGATNAFAMYMRDPSGNRLELYTGDYLRDLDRPALLWRPADYAGQGHSWWGHPPPPTFPETQPLIADGWAR